MKKSLWKRRIATLLIMCMVATQMVVPVSVQASNSSKAAETVEIPKEYETLTLERDEEIVDLSEATQEVSQETADEDAVLESIKTYESIPVVGEKPLEKEEETTEPVEAPEAAEAVTKTKVVDADAEEVSLETAEETAGTVTLGQAQMVYVTVPNEVTTYEFIPEKSGDYVFSLWEEGEGIGSYMYVQDSSGTVLDNCWGEYVRARYLEGGKTYYLNVTASDYGYCYFSVAEPETITANSGNSVSINSVGLLEIDPGNESKLVQVKVESNADFFVSRGGAGFTHTVNGYYQFYINYKTNCYIINKGTDTMWVDVTMSMTSLPEVVMEEDAVRTESSIMAVQTENGAWEYWCRFTPDASGKYVFYSDSEYSSNGWWTLQYRDESGSIYGVGSDSGSFLIDLNAGQEYIVQEMNLSEGNVCIEKLDKQSLTLGKESTNTFATSLAYYEISGLEESGIYEMTLSGDMSTWKFKSPYFNLGDLVYEQNGGVKTVYLRCAEGQNWFVVSTPSTSATLGNLTISLKKKDVALTLDSLKHAKKSVDMTSYDDTWVSFTPEVGGEYVIGTEDKADLPIAANIYEESEDGYLNDVAFDETQDNINIHADLEAGKTYYYKSHISYVHGTPETANIVIYPVTEVSYNVGEEVKTDIRKAVTYTMNVPKAGFYQMNVNGADESYFIDVEDGDGNSYVNNSFVYKDIPRIFQFKRAGTYKIRVTKELMSDSADTITFSCTSDAALQVLEGTNQATVEVENTDGVWIEYMPQESGWYSLEIDKKKSKFKIELSIESEDGTELLYKSSDGNRTISGGTSFIYYLEEGRKCYYRVYPRTETTGTVTVKMSSVADTIVADEDSIPEFTPSSRLAILETGFAEKHFTKLAADTSICIMDVTEGINDSFRYIYNNNIALFPAGEHEYLLFFSQAEETGNVAFNAWEPDATLTSEIKLEDTESYTKKWAKFVPEESGLYSLVLKSKTPNSSDFESYVELYQEGERNLQYVDSIFEGTAFLTAGVSYYYEICLDYYGDEESGVSAEYVLEKVEMQDETFGMGSNTISMNNVGLFPAEVAEGKYLSLTPEDLDDSYRFYWIALYEDSDTYSWISSRYVDGVINDLEFYEGFFDSYGDMAKLCVLIKKESYSAETKDITFTLKETDIISRELEEGAVVNEPASSAIKEYTFTADDSIYKFAIDSDVSVHNIATTDGLEDWIEWDYEHFVDSTGEENRCYIVTVEEGKTYTITFIDQSAYTFREVEPKMVAAYDYDEYEAYIASGGTINLVDSITDEMWDKIDNEYASYDYDWMSKKYVFKDSSEFKNKADIWWPYYLYNDNVIEDMVVKAYYDISEYIEGTIGYGRYLTAGLFSIGTSSSTTPKEVKTTDTTPGNEILLHLREPVNVLIQKITLTGLTAMEVGQTSKLTATTSTLNKYNPTKPGVTFASSNPAVASVDAQGNVTAKSAGTAVITCTSVDGNAKESITIKVKQSIITAASVTITGASDTLYVGDELSLSATIGTNGKGKPTVDGVAWSSSDETIATVDADGKVTGIKEGSVTITAASKDGYAKNSVTISVKPVKATSIKLNESQIRMKKGTTYRWLEATVSPENTTDKSVEWTSSNQKVATVSATGVIKAKAVGSAVITATTENGLEDTVKVTVTASNIKVKKIILDKKMTVLAGEVIRLKPEVEPVNATNNKVEYKSSNPEVATVTKAGVVSAKKPGKATITVKAKDGTGKKATCVITVKAPEKTKITSIESNAKKQVTLTWEEVEGADGYVIYMSTGKKGKYKVVATINNGKTTMYTVKKLKSKKKAYFKVVPFVKARKNKVYGKDSPVKNIKVK